jgi:hypothetical protein
MTPSSSDLENRLNELTARIDRLRAEVEHGVEPEVIEYLMEFGSVLHRYHQIARHLGKGAPTPARPQIETPAEIVADLETVEQRLRNWIARRRSRS